MFNTLTFRMRLSLIMVIGTGLLKTGNWSILIIYAIIGLTWCIYLKTPINTLYKILGAELILLSLMSLPLGWEKASFLLSRSLICLLILNSCLLTIPKYSFSIALKAIPLPAELQEIVILTVQYLEILISEVKQMQTSAKLRGLKGHSQWLRYTSSAMIGSLYLRSLDRAERVYNAMIIRGYEGVLPIQSDRNKKEEFFLIIFAMIIGSLTFTSYRI